MVEAPRGKKWSEREILTAAGDATGDAWWSDVSESAVPRRGPDVGSRPATNSEGDVLGNA
jgi:hypothetical protein